jgi:hypothetical protein
MTPLELFVVIGLGLLLLPLLGKVLHATVPVLRARLAAAVPVLAGLAHRALRWTGRLLTNLERLSPPEALAQAVGAALMMAAGVIFALCDLQLTLATLAPLLGLEFHHSGGIFAGFDQLLGLSVVLLAATFGVILSDLLGWTCLTRFAVTERARVGAFCLGFVCFLAALAVAVALAAYRLPAVLADGAAEAPGEIAVWMQSLPAIILLTLAALLFLGIAAALLSAETFCALVTALLVVVGAVGLGAVSLLLRAIDMVAEVFVTGVAALSMEPLTQAMAGGAHRVGQKVASGGRAVAAWLRKLVQRDTRVSTQAAGEAISG